MAVNDAVTFDGAMSAALQSQGTWITDAVAADYAALSAAALAFATQFDTALLAAGGAGANANRGLLSLGICAGVLAGRPLLNTPASGTAASYTAVAAAAAAAYINAKPNLS